LLVPTASLAPAVTYSLATALPSVTLYDYWDPVAAVSRVVAGAAVDALEISVNGDYHEFVFSGPAADLLDSSSFVPGSAGLASFPTEPALSLSTTRLCRDIWAKLGLAVRRLNSLR